VYFKSFERLKKPKIPTPFNMRLGFRVMEEEIYRSHLIFARLLNTPRLLIINNSQKNDAKFVLRIDEQFHFCSETCSSAIYYKTIHHIFLD